MADTDEPQSGKPRRLDRRSLLLGAAAGAAGAAAIGAGVLGVREKARALVTPAALPAGQAPQIARSFQDSRPAAEAAARAPAGAPNLVVIVLDDVGFGDLGCFGGEIRTPAMDGLAAGGLRYANFRTCAMCSPTRAALMTGLNHHSAGMGWLADIDSGYPGYRGDLTRDAATLAEVLREAGWSTLMTGKWHLNSAASTGANGPYENWPTSRGFERAYWFQGHSTDYFKPCELFDGVAPVEPPERADYFANDDFTDRAIEYVRTQKALAPDKPFFLYVGFPGAHSPLQARARERDAYRGAYDAGWDAIRAARLERQRKTGLVAETVSLPPLSPGAQSWDTLSAEERRLYARYMEVYAALVSNVDGGIARLLATLDDLGARDNTLVMVFSDNGGSAEGTPTGTPNVLAPAFGRPVPVAEAAKLYDVMGEDATFPHYPIGWSCASNTPFRMYKQYAHLGGVADPLIVAWPKRIAARGEIRQQFVHVIDLFPTLLEAAGVARPASYAGRAQKPVEGRSIASTFGDKAAATRTEQYFELSGNRAYLDGKWRLVTRHERGTKFDDDRWELYDVTVDPNELVDLAAKHPDVVAALAAKWDAAAQRHGVFPLDDRNLVIRLVQDRQAKGLRPHWELRPPIERLARDVAPIVCGLTHRIEIEIDRPAGRGDGVLLAHGSKFAGFAIWIQDGRLCYEQSLVPWFERFASPSPLPAGRVTVAYEQKMTSRPFDGDGALLVNGARVAEHRFKRVLFSTSYDGLSVGADLGNQVSTAYRGTFPFQGTIAVVRIDVDTTAPSLVETTRFVKELGLRV